MRNKEAREELEKEVITPIVRKEIEPIRTVLIKVQERLEDCEFDLKQFIHRAYDKREFCPIKDINGNTNDKLYTRTVVQMIVEYLGLIYEPPRHAGGRLVKKEE